MALHSPGSIAAAGRLARSVSMALHPSPDPSAASRNIRPVAALLAVLTGCPLVRFGLLPQGFGMQLPSVLRSLPSRLRTVRVPKALLRLGRFLVQFLGVAVC
jgi:hypothetical protein